MGRAAQKLQVTTSITNIMVPLLFLSIILSSLSSTESLSCLPCDQVRCSAAPTCCKSGFYTTGACGCCQICAQAENEQCGGPWNSYGNCATGTRCLRQCECKAVGGEDCIFPFKFKGKTYTSCTTAESVNGAAWCATKVDSDDNVVRNFWKDCEEGCPGMELGATVPPCTSDGLFNVAGRCISNTSAVSLERKL